MNHICHAIRSEFWGGTHDKKCDEINYRYRGKLIFPAEIFHSSRDEFSTEFSDAGDRQLFKTVIKKGKLMMIRKIFGFPNAFSSLPFSNFREFSLKDTKFPFSNQLVIFLRR